MKNIDYKFYISTVIGLIGILTTLPQYTQWILFFWGAVLLFCISITIICVKNWYRITYFLRINNIKGIVGYYQKRSRFDWSKFYNQFKQPKEVIFMGQALSKAFSEKQIQLFTQWCNKGTDFKILLLSPSNPYSQQLKSVSEGMEEAPSDLQPQSILSKKIYKTIEDIETKFINQIKGEKSKKPYLRFSTVDLPFSFVMIDGTMIVTLYMATQAEADTLPTFTIKGSWSPSFREFKKEFDNIWEKHTVVSPYKDIVLINNLKYWKDYLTLKKSYYNNSNIDINKQAPKQAIIFTTYKCSNSCSFCMFKEKRDNIAVSANDFKNILNQLIACNINNIELSGGGEPLEADEIRGILDIIMEVRKKSPLVKFGLITNGLQIESLLKDYDLLYIFNDYIRISRLNEDDIDEKNNTFKAKYNTWLKGVNLLYEKKQNNFAKYKNTKIGIKYLLSSTNKDSFVKTVNGDIHTFLDKVDHIRFRSERTVASDVIFPIEQEIYQSLRNAEKIKSSFKDKVAMSLPNVYYPHNFKCWISPMHVIIDPKGDIYICCNYLTDSSKSKIGNILNTSFKAIWESDDHVKARHNLNKDMCSCNTYCSNCRYAELQFGFEHIISTLDYNYTEK